MSDNEPQHPEVDDLGLTSEDWDYLQFAYNLGTIEPAPGTVDEEAFRRMDEYALREVERAAEEADEVWRASKRRCEPQAGLEPEAGQ
jgi:hypothetical protein